MGGGLVTKGVLGGIGAPRGGVFWRLCKKLKLGFIKQETEKRDYEARNSKKGL